MMEEWQKRYIRDNLDQLIEKTRVSTLFIAKLKYMSTADEDSMKASTGEHGKCKLIYDIAITRQFAYETLVKALYETNQSGAFRILLHGFVINGVYSVFEKCGIMLNYDDPLLEILWKELKPVILKFNVEFQGLIVPLENLLAGLNGKTRDNICKNYLTTNMLTDFINNQRLVLVKNSVPELLSFYIQRKVTSRHRLDPEMFSNTSDDVFVIKHIEPHELSLIAKNQDTGVSSNQLHDLTVRFVLLEHEQDFDKICKLSSGKPVHLLEYNAGRLTWRSTHGDIKTLQKYVHTIQDEFNEEDFTTTCLETSHSVCISDTPGMGKTVLLTILAANTKKIFPERLVRFIVLREFVPEVIKRKGGVIDKETLMEIITEQSSDSEFGRKIVWEMLESENYAVQLIFDGFDEVLFDHVKTAKEILRTVAQFKSVRMFVTTRPHMRDDLEKTLQVLSYKMLPFSFSEQTEFLTRFWSENGATNKDKLEEFAKTCLNALKGKMNDFEHDFAGIPLQCRLLGEVYQEEATKYSVPKNRVTVYNTGIIIRIKSIFEIYTKFMKLRLQKVSINDNDTRKYIVAHVYAALKLPFPDILTKKHSYGVARNPYINDRELYALGILEQMETANMSNKNRTEEDNEQLPRFVHRTFAEYFLGLFTVDMLNSEHKQENLFKASLFDLFFHKVLRTITITEQPFCSLNLGYCEPIRSSKFCFPVICYFINAHLKAKPFQICKPWITEPDKLYSILSACVTQDCETLYKLTSEAHTQLLTDNCFKLQTLHILAAKHSSLELFKMVHLHVTQFLGEAPSYVSSSAPTFTITALHIAVERGNYHLTEFLLNRQRICRLRNLDEVKYVMHCCVHSTACESDARILEKIEIIHLLTKICPDWLNECLPDDTSPILQFSVHVRLLELLMELGANVNVINRHGCILHRIVENHLSSENYYTILLRTIASGFCQFDTVDSKKRTPLHLALQKTDELDKAIQLFHFKQANFNAVDENGDSILFYAVRAGKSVNLLRQLLSFGAVVGNYNIYGENVLHVCSKHGCHQALEFFLISRHLKENDILAENKIGLTPFTQGLGFGKGLTVRLIKLMEEGGLQITKRLASKALKSLISNRNIGAWELSTEFVSVADYLIDKGGRVECRYGKRPWELEATKLNIDSIALVIECNDALLHELKIRQVCLKDVCSNTESQYSETVLADLKKLGIVVNEIIINELPINRSKMLLEVLQASNQNTFERLCISLISCKQIQPFIQLKQCLLTDTQDFTMFVTPPTALVDFMQPKDKNIAVLKSWDIDLSIQRIKDMIDPDAAIIDERDLDKELPQLCLIVHRSKTLSKVTIQKLMALERKTIFLCSHNLTWKDLSEYDVCYDEVMWKDLSTSYQSHLVSINGVLFTDNLHSSDYSHLKNEALTKFICNNEFEIIKFESYNEQSQCKTFPVCLCGSHPVGSANIIWNVCRFPKHNLTCWVNVLEILPKMGKSNIDISAQRLGLVKLFETACNANSKTEIWKNINQRFQLRSDIISYRDVRSLLMYSEKECDALKQVAVNTLFPKLLKTLNPLKLQKYIEVGLLHYGSETLLFVHKSLAWYFIAELVLMTEKVNYVDMIYLLHELLFHNCFESQSVRISHMWWYNTSYDSNEIQSLGFINTAFFTFLEALLVSDHNKETISNCLKQNLSYEFTTKWIHACVCGNHFHLLKIMLEIVNHHSAYISAQLVILAVKCSEVPVIDLVVQHYILTTYKKIKDINIKLKWSFNCQAWTIVSVLHLATLRGNSSVIKYLLKNHEFKDTLDLPRMKNLLRFCVLDTKEHDEKLEERKRIITLLLELNPNFIERGDENKSNFLTVPKPLKKDNYGRNPLTVPNIHVDLVLYLIQLGVDVNTTGNLRYENIMHLCPAYMTPQEYDKLVQTLHTNGETKIFHSRDKWQCTPLHRAMTYLEVLDSTLETFRVVKFDFNAVSDAGNTVLHCAVNNKRSARLLDSLIRASADINKTNYFNRNVVHLAAKEGNLTALRYFISRGCDVNAKDSENYTPIDLTMEVSKTYTDEIVKLLLSHGADVSKHGPNKNSLIPHFDFNSENENFKIVFYV